MGVSILTFPDEGSWAQAGADALWADITTALQARGAALVAVAGGRTPWPILARLSAKDADWGRVTFIPTDDRCVTDDHPARNLGQLRQSLATALEAGAKALPLEAGKVYSPDAVLLGFGADSHVASLFASAEGIGAALDPNGARTCVLVTPRPLPPEAPYPRMSLTLAALLTAPRVHLASIGAPKRAVFEAALADNSGSTPLAAVLQQTQTPAALYHYQETEEC